MGLANGRALFKILQRDPETLKDQAHVYTAPTPKVPKTEEIEEEKPKPPPILHPNKKRILDPISMIKAEKESVLKPNDAKQDYKVQNEIEDKEEDDVCPKSINKQTKQEEETSMEVDGNSEIKVKPTIEKKIEEVPEVLIVSYASSSFEFNLFNRF